MVVIVADATTGRDAARPSRVCACGRRGICSYEVLLFVMGNSCGFSEAVVSNFHDREVILDDKQRCAGGIVFSLNGAHGVCGEKFEVVVGDAGYFGADVECQEMFVYIDAVDDTRRSVSLRII